MVSREEVQRRYSALVLRYFEKPQEEALCSAAELGAELVEAELPPEELAELHERSLHSLVERHPELTPLETIKRVTAPLTELLMAYGVAFRSRRAERERLETDLERARRLESIGRLAGGVAHDFNNLLTVILGNAEVLLLETSLAEPARDCIKEIDAAGQSAASLTRQLLTFGRRDRRETRPLNLNAVLNDRRLLLERLAGEQVELLMELGETPLTVRADLGQVEQVILNLVANALDAMPEGGRLSISTTTVERSAPAACPTPCPVDCETGRCVMLTVGDSGFGMDAETRARIFDPFFTTKKVGEGAGLGLSVVHEVVAQTGGHLYVESSPGEGSRFRLLFPTEAAAPLATDLDARISASPRGTETILLVEDDPAVLKIARSILERAGYSVISASSGAQALQAARGSWGSVGLLVTDVVMPGMRGPELVERIRSLDPELPVLYVSGMPGTQSLVGRVLPKPFSKRKLLLAVRQALDAR